MPYEIKTITDINDAKTGNIAKINVYNWGGDYRPESTAILCYIKDKGFVINLNCKEQNPRAEFKSTEQNMGVCQDSCLEFFANFAPKKAGMGYVNFEGNANGSLLCAYGTSVETRETIEQMNIPHPKAEPYKTDTEWGYQVFIPLALIRAVYGDDVCYSAGDKIMGNFFKCGDKTATPHYGSYTVIDPKVIKNPSFHRPNYFADMVIVE